MLIWLEMPLLSINHPFMFFFFLFSVFLDVREPIQSTKKAKLQPLVSRVGITALVNPQAPKNVCFYS